MFSITKLFNLNLLNTIKVLIFSNYQIIGGIGRNRIRSGCQDFGINSFVIFGVGMTLLVVAVSMKSLPILRKLSLKQVIEKK